MTLHLQNGTSLWEYCKKDRILYNRISNRVKTNKCTVEEAIKMKTTMGRKPDKLNVLTREIARIIKAPLEKVRKAIYNCNKHWYRRLF